MEEEHNPRVLGAAPRGTRSPRCPDAGSHRQHLGALPATSHARCSPCLAAITPQQLLFLIAGATQQTVEAESVTIPLNIKQTGGETLQQTACIDRPGPCSSVLFSTSLVAAAPPAANEMQKPCRVSFSPCNAF